MDAKKQMDMIKNLFDEVYTKGNLDICSQMLDEDIRWYDPAINVKSKGLNHFMKMQKLYTKAFPDKVARIDDMFSHGDKVFVSWTITGTHKGNLDDIPASNKPIKVSGMTVYRFSNGKICEKWQTWDRLGLLEQIGEIRPAHAALHA